MAVKSIWPVQTDHLSNSLRVKRRPRPCWVKKKGHQWSRLVKIKKLKQQQIIKLDKFKSQSVINTPFDSACWSSSVEIAPLLSLSTLWITKKLVKIHFRYSPTQIHQLYFVSEATFGKRSTRNFDHVEAEVDRSTPSLEILQNGAVAQLCAISLGGVGQKN